MFGLRDGCMYHGREKQSQASSYHSAAPLRCLQHETTVQAFILHVLYLNHAAKETADHRLVASLEVGTEEATSSNRFFYTSPPHI